MLKNYDGLDDWMVFGVKASNRVAKKLGGIHGEIVSRDDLASIGYEWCWANPDKVQTYHESNRSVALGYVLYRRMQLAIAKERARITGSQTSDAFYYTTSLVEQALEQAWNPTDRVVPQVMDETSGRSSAAPNEGNNWATVIADIQRAVKRLDLGDRVMLMQRYDRCLTVDEIASLHDITPEATAKRIERLLVSIVDLLGGESPYKNRRPRGNAHAQAITKNTEEGKA